MDRLIFARTVDEFRRLAREANIDVKKNGATLLHTFCSLGRVDLVEYLLGRVGVPITQNLDTRQTPLHCTLDCSNDADQDRKRCHILRLLLNPIRGSGGASRPDINARDINGWTPLKMACRAGLVECARYLLHSGANVDIRDKEGFGAIHDAVGHPNVIAELIPYYDNVNVATFHLETPLLLAVKQGKFNTVQYLVHSGANVNKEDVFGVFPLLAAARLRDTNILQILIDSRANIDAQEPKEGQTALHEIAKVGSIAPALVLIKGGARHDTKNEEGKTAYECALAHSVELAKAMRGAFQERGIFLPSEETLKSVKEAFVLCASGSPDQLVAHLKENNVGVNVNLKRRTLVHCAVENFRLDVLHVLSQLGADIGAINDVRNTSLHLACRASQDHEKSFRILQYLLTHKIPINSQNEAGETPLFAAANDGLARHVDLLLRSGASPDIRNCKGGLPLHASCTSPTCSVECVELLLWDNPRTVNRVNDKGWTALMCAVKSNAVDIARLLVAKKADVNVQPKSGREDTALFLASEAKSYDLCQILVEHGAKINVTVGRRRISPFHQVAMSSDQDPVSKDICRLFARHGGDLTKKDLHGNSVLSLVEKAFKEKLKVCAEEGPLPNKERVETPSATETISSPNEDDDPLSIQNKKISFGRTTSDSSSSKALEQLSSPPVLPADRRRDSTDGAGVNSAEKSNLMDFVIDAGEYSQVYSTAQQQQIQNADQSHQINETMDQLALSPKPLLPPDQFYKTPNDLSHLSAVEIPKQKLGSSGLFNFPNASSSSSAARRSSAPQAATALPKEQKEKEKKTEYAAPRPGSAFPATSPEIAAAYANATTSPVDEGNLPPAEAKKPPSPPRKRKEPTCTREDLMPTWQLRKEDIKTGRLLGTGGFGDVYAGTFRGLTVAVKELKNIGSMQDKIIETFFKEVEIMSKLRHEFVTRFVGACCDEGYYCIVTELMGRGSLFDVLHKRTITLRWSRRVSMSCNAAQGMDYLHSKTPPVLHRDLKSMNLLVAEDFTTKVADFGLTRTKEHTLTMMSSTRGTPAYMSPELLHAQKVSEKIDVYAFGIVLCEIATREIPFSDQQMNALQLMFAVCKGSRPTLPRSSKEAPQSFCDLARMCWEEKADARPNFADIVRRLKGEITDEAKMYP